MKNNKKQILRGFCNWISYEKCFQFSGFSIHFPCARHFLSIEIVHFFPLGFVSHIHTHTHPHFSCFLMFPLNGKSLLNVFYFFNIRQYISFTRIERKRMKKRKRFLLNFKSINYSKCIRWKQWNFHAILKLNTPECIYKIMSVQYNWTMFLPFFHFNSLRISSQLHWNTFHRNEWSWCSCWFCRLVWPDLELYVCVVVIALHPCRLSMTMLDFDLYN